MTNFFDIRFLIWNNIPECRAQVDKYFDYYVLDFAEHGRLELTPGNSRTVQLNGPVAWLTYPGIRFKFTGSWHHRYIAFKGKFADELVRQKIFPIDYPIIPIHNSTRFTIAFDELLNYLDNPVRGSDRAANTLVGLLLQLHEQKTELRFQQMDGRIKKFIEMMKQSPAENWDFKTEAAKMNLSLSHFRKLFTTAVNQPPGEFLTCLRMAMAAEMLKNTSLPISEIAELCSYEDIYYFNKSFKKYHSIPPGRYRQTNL